MKEKHNRVNHMWQVMFNFFLGFIVLGLIVRGVGELFGRGGTLLLVGAFLVWFLFVYMDSDA